MHSALRRLCGFLFTAVLVASVAFIAATASQLPDPVASHFNGAGAATGWMPRVSYLLYMLGFAVLLPLAVVAQITAMARFVPRWLNIPNRVYWLSPERRENTLAALDGFALALGSLLAVLVLALHVTLLAANAVVPPHAPASGFAVFLGVFGAALTVWIVALLMRFHRVT